MTKSKTFAALAIAGLFGFAGVSNAEVNGSGNFTETDKEQGGFCEVLPFACAGTQSNGGGKDPEKPIPDETK